MKRTRYIILSLNIVAVLLVAYIIFDGEIVRELAIKSTKETSHNRIERSRPVYFAHKKLDSLYDANNYRYFCFITNKEDGEKLVDGVEKETLKIYSDKHFTDSDIDSRSLLEHAFLFEMLTIDNASSLFLIESVNRKHHGGYLYGIVKP